MKQGAEIKGAGRARRRGTRGAVWAALLIRLPAEGAPGVTIEPERLDAAQREWVTVTVSNLAPGATLDLGLVVDVNGNGHADLPAEPSLAVFRIVDGATNTLSGGSVGTFRLPSFTGAWEFGAYADRAGRYAMLVPTGTFAVVANGFRGHVSRTYRDHAQWEWNNGVVADPFLVGTAGLAGVDFVLPPAALIRGPVLATNAPLAAARVNAFTPAGEWRGEAWTDAAGAYELEVPPASNLVIRNDRYDASLATPVAPAGGAVEGGVDFGLRPGFLVHGTVRGPGLRALRAERGW